MWRRLLLLMLLSGTALAAGAADDRVRQIVRIHRAALGGPEKVAALGAFRARGRIVSGDQSIPFTMIAQRPNRLRMEFHFPRGTLVHATDGIHAPWELDHREPQAKRRPMNEVAREAFLSDARFDTALAVTQPADEVVEYGGRRRLETREYLQVLVTRSLSKTYFLLVDPDTYLITARIDPALASGWRREVVTTYADYRPVAGVLMPHRITLTEQGGIAQEALLELIEPNPVLPAGMFDGVGE